MPQSPRLTGPVVTFVVRLRVLLLLKLLTVSSTQKTPYAGFLPLASDLPK
jgi:hypothetical protein